MHSRASAMTYFIPLHHHLILQSNLIEISAYYFIQKLIAYNKKYILHLFTSLKSCQHLGAHTGVAFLPYFAASEYKTPICVHPVLSLFSNAKTAAALAQLDLCSLPSISIHKSPYRTNWGPPETPRCHRAPWCSLRVSGCVCLQLGSRGCQQTPVSRTAIRVILCSFSRLCGKRIIFHSLKFWKKNCK